MNRSRERSSARSTPPGPAVLPPDLEEAIERVVRAALQEDLGGGDLTGELILNPQMYGRGHIVARRPGVMAGFAAARQVFRMIDPTLSVTARKGEGASFEVDETLVELEGSIASIVAGERTALNLLQRLCGIATETARYVAELAGTGVTLLDTRKTTPGLRLLEKYAVRMGGGVNHRRGLYDAVLIKENHLRAVGGVREALERVRRALPTGERPCPITVEVTNHTQIEEAIAGGADWLLLDNMSLEQLADSVALARRLSSRPIKLEASGGITLETVRAVASAGVDAVSVGALTHSVKAIDLSLLLK
jgi:nicotinate-nucleotide pyrophosphorylase (carboxylating)